MGLLDDLKRYATPIVVQAAPSVADVVLDTINTNAAVPALVPNGANKHVIPLLDRALPSVKPGVRRAATWIGTDVLLAPNFAHRPNLWGSGGVSPPTTGNAITTLVDTEYRDALIDAIKRANKSIWIESFQFYDDASGRAVAQAILERQRELGGKLDIRILYDNRDLPEQVVNPSRPPATPSWVATLTAEGAEIHRVQYAGARINHRKISIIDGETAFIGGQNIGDAYMTPGSYHDLSQRVRGPATYDAAVVFNDSWKRSAGSPLKLPIRMGAVGDSKAEVRVISHSGGLDRNIERELVRAINAENGEIVMANGFGMSDQIRDALIRAAKRNVKVTWLWGPAAHGASLMAQEAFPALRAAGVRLVRYPGYMHTKASYFRDTNHLIQGSSNYDGLSTFLNDECVLSIKGGDEPAAFHSRVLGPDIAKSSPITGPVETPVDDQEALKMKLFERLVDND